jgi:hypothetical protein
MKILCYVPYAINTPHYETQLEIIEDHLKAGDEVILLGCNAEKRTCDVNIPHQSNLCAKCISKRNSGLKLLSQEIKVMSFLNLRQENIEEFNTLKRVFKDVEELKQYKIDEFDIGMAVSSSLISVFRDPVFSTIKYEKLVDKFISTTHQVYRSIENHLLEQKPDRVYVFNGRFAPLRAALRACQKYKVECHVHEVGHTIKHYSIWVNTTIHDINYFHQKMIEKWEKDEDLTRRNEIAESFYKDRYNGKKYVYLSYTEKQEKNLLPTHWDKSKKNIVVFNSSEDEYAAIGDLWKNPMYKDQTEGFMRILKSVEQIGDNSIHLTLRIHPNLTGVKNKSVDELLSLKSPYLTVIPAEDPVSTYSLLDESDVVLSFGSSVGIEATYWGKPSILAGRCLYMHLESTYNPQTHEELVNLIQQELPPKDKEGALKYGYFLNSYGIPFKYYSPQSIFVGKFKDQSVAPKRIISTIDSLSKRNKVVNVLINKFDRIFLSLTKNFL